MYSHFILIFLCTNIKILTPYYIGLDDSVFIAKYNEIKSLHELPSNFKNDLNTVKFEKYLQGIKRQNVNINYIKEGWPIFKRHDKQTKEFLPLSTKVSHHANSYKEIIEIIDKFITEIKTGKIEPINYTPKYIINCFCVPKKDKNGNYTKFRVVRNGSFSTKETTAINEWINKKKCKMPTLPNIKKYVKMLIDKNWFALRDLADAFRQIGVNKADDDYLGYCIFGLFFRDRKQPYGISSAAANCQSFADLLIWIMNNKILPSRLSDSILAHIDDFVIAATTKQDCSSMENKFDALLNELNVKMSTHKSIHLCQSAELYGLQFDLKNKTVGIPPSKFKKLTGFIDKIIKHRIISGKALEKICGKIMHWSQLTQPAKPLCYNMLNHIFKNIRSGKIKKTDWVVLPLSVIDDLKFWRQYADFIRSVPMTEILQITSFTISAATDASSTTAGVMIGSEYFYYDFLKEHSKWHINQKEAHALLTMIETQKLKLTGRTVRVYIDNQVLFYAMSRKWSSKRSMMMFIYEICLLLIRYKINIYVEWIGTKRNTIADCLSRKNMNDFYRECNKYNMIHKQIPFIYYDNFTFDENSHSKQMDYDREYQEFYDQILINGTK